MKLHLKYMAMVIVAGMVAGCGGGDGPAEPTATGTQTTSATASGMDLPEPGECRPDTAITRVSKASSAVRALPEDHPRLEELQTAAGSMIEKFNEAESASNGMTPEAALAQMCAAYDEFYAVAQAG